MSSGKFRQALKTTPIVTLSVKMTDWQLREIIKRNCDIAPFVVKLMDFEADNRELWQIPEVAVFCQRLVALGMISLMEVTTLLIEPRTPNEELNWGSMGAIEVWLLATGQFKPGAEVAQGTIDRFQYEVLLPANERCDKIACRAASA